MNISAVNLNLLVALDALLLERNVTRAARRVGVSQPAMSHSLSQLRSLFGDPLFRRTGRGLEPTARALALEEPLRAGLSTLASTLAPRTFDPGSANRTFVVAASDYVEFVLLPPLLNRLRATAPGVQLQIRPWGLHEVPEALAKGEVDLMIGYYERVPPRHHHELIFEEDYVCVVRKRHPAVRSRLTLSRYVQLEHVLVSQVAESPGSVDRALQKLGKRRRIAARVSHFLMVPVLVARTDAVAALSRRVAEAFAGPLGLRIFPPPVELPRARVGQVWHERTDGDPAQEWLRATIRDVAHAI